MESTAPEPGDMAMMQAATKKVIQVAKLIVGPCLFLVKDGHYAVIAAMRSRQGKILQWIPQRKTTQSAGTPKNFPA
jgi:hypothetical protein